MPSAKVVNLPSPRRGVGGEASDAIDYVLKSADVGLLCIHSLASTRVDEDGYDAEVGSIVDGLLSAIVQARLGVLVERNIEGIGMRVGCVLDDGIRQTAFEGSVTSTGCLNGDIIKVYVSNDARQRYPRRQIGVAAVAAVTREGVLLAPVTSLAIEVVGTRTYVRR